MSQSAIQQKWVSFRIQIEYRFIKKNEIRSADEYWNSGCSGLAITQAHRTFCTRVEVRYLLSYAGDELLRFKIHFISPVLSRKVKLIYILSSCSRTRHKLNFLSLYLLFKLQNKSRNFMSVSVQNFNTMQIFAKLHV